MIDHFLGKLNFLELVAIIEEANQRLTEAILLESVRTAPKGREPKRFEKRTRLPKYFRAYEQQRVGLQ